MAATTEVTPTPSGEVDTPPAPLWRNWRFQLLWVGSSTAFLGTGVADFAYPLVILAMTRSPALAAVFAFIQTACSLAAALPAGALVDRWDRRRALMLAELIRAVVAASVCIAWAFGHLTLAHLLIVSAVLGATIPLGASARMLVVQAVVPPAQLTAAMTQDQVRTAATGLAGPPLGGVLLAAGRALPFLACAITFVVSFMTALIVRIPTKVAAAPSDGATASGGMLAGVIELWRDRVIRSAMLTICIINIGGGALYLAVVVQLSQQGASVRSIGVAVAGEAVGFLLGVGLVGTLHRRIAPGALLLLAITVLTIAVALLAIPLGPWWVFGMLAVAVLGLPAVEVLIDVLILRRVPDERRGRTMTALMALVTVGIPVGTLVGGLLLQFAGATVTILVIAAGCAAGLARGASDPQLRHAQWPANA